MTKLNHFPQGVFQKCRIIIKREQENERETIRKSRRFKSPVSSPTRSSKISISSVTLSVVNSVESGLSGSTDLLIETAQLPDELDDNINNVVRYSPRGRNNWSNVSSAATGSRRYAPINRVVDFSPLHDSDEGSKQDVGNDNRIHPVNDNLELSSILSARYSNPCEVSAFAYQDRQWDAVQNS